MNTFSGTTYLIAGTKDDILRVLQMLQESGIETDANPDLYVREYRQFGIDDAHELRARASSRAIGERRVFVIAASAMTNEAQNALLKTLEEPPLGTLFMLIVPAPEMLLATVRSRSQMLQLAGLGASGKKDQIEADAFFAANPAKRIEMLKPVLAKDDDDKYDTGAILVLLSALERHAATIKNKAVMKDISDTLYRARMYITDRGALVKTLLESIALLAPVL
jgi:hypothetical protein